jgi:aspartate aminotransferase
MKMADANPHPFLAPRMASAKPSPTAAVSDEARRLRSEGKNIINLGEGELDFATPVNIRQAAITAMENGDTKYTAVSGTAEMKTAICTKFKRDNNLTYAANEVIASCGAKQIIFNAFQATISAGEEVIIPAPYWVSYPDMVRLADGEPVIVSCTEEAIFKLTADQLDAAITPKTKWVILNSPSNPTGALYSAAELEALAVVLRKHDHVFVLADDIYEHIVYEGKFASFAEVAPDLKERTLTVNGVSKCYSMTGWRVGYAGGPAFLIKALEILQSQSTSNPASISQAAAVEALNGDISFIQDWIKVLKARRDIVLDACAQTNGILTANAPNSAFYVYANCAGAIGKKCPDGSVIENDVDVATYLLQAAGTAVIPGVAFGLSPFMRIAYALDTDDLKTACAAIVKACAELKDS